MKSALYAFSVILVLTSCNSGSSGPAKSQEQILIEANSATDYSKQIEMNHFTIIKANLTADEEKERFRLGCKTPGSDSGSIDEIDRSLQVGQIFKEQNAGSRILGDSSFSVKEEIVTAIEPKKISFDENFEKLELEGMPFTSVDQIFSRKPHVKSELTYSIEPNGGHTTTSKTTEFNFTEAASDFLKSRMPTKSSFLACHVEYDKDNYKSTRTIDKIFYNLNGKNVVGFLSKNKQVGNVVCEQYRETDGKTNSTPDFKVSMGHGQNEYNDLMTNDVVHPSFVQCGGEVIFRMSKISLDSGKILSVFVEKTLAAPER